ncbi:hypothetical protein D3C78_1322290 [compost metagenome]
MDGLHVVALLGRQRGAHEQFGHAQHAVHRGADLVADPGEELGLGLLLGQAGGLGAAGAEVGMHVAALAGGELVAVEEQAEQAGAQQGDVAQWRQGRPLAAQAEQQRQRAEAGQQQVLAVATEGEA